MSIEPPVSTKHRRNMTEKLLKARLNQNNPPISRYVDYTFFKSPGGANPSNILVVNSTPEGDKYTFNQP